MLQLSLGKSTAPMLAAIFLRGFYDERINTGQWLSVMMTVAGVLFSVCLAFVGAGGVA